MGDCCICRVTGFSCTERPRGEDSGMEGMRGSVDLGGSDCLGSECLDSDRDDDVCHE